MNKDNNINLVYEIAKDYIKEYYPHEFEIFDLVWDTLEIKNFKDLEDMYIDGFASLNKQDNLSFDLTSPLFCELVIAITANIVSGYIKKSVEEVKMKMKEKNVRDKIKREIENFKFRH